MKRVLLVPLAALFLLLPSSFASAHGGGATPPPPSTVPTPCDDSGEDCGLPPDVCVVAGQSDGSTPSWDECDFPGPPPVCYDDGAAPPVPEPGTVPGGDGGQPATSEGEEICGCPGWSEPGEPGEPGEGGPVEPQSGGSATADSGTAVGIGVPEGIDDGCTYEECHGVPECVDPVPMPGVLDKAAQKRAKARKAAKARRARIRARKRKARLKQKRQQARRAASKRG